MWAEGLEAKVWDYVRGVLTQPGCLEVSLQKLIEEGRNALRGDPGKETKALLQRLSEVDRRRTRCQEMSTQELIGFEEPRERLSQLNKAKRLA